MPKTGAVTVRLDPELKGRLARASTKLDLSENDIVRHALRVAVNAIEANDYKMQLPLQVRKRRRTQRGDVLRLIQNPFSNGEC